MSNLPSFQNLASFSRIAEDNEFFTQYTNKNLYNYYDANYILLKYSPTLAEFEIIKNLHEEYQLSIQQNHLKFYWPENTGLYPDVLHYLNDENYAIGKQELMLAYPKDFSIRNGNQDIEMRLVSGESLDLFLALNNKEDRTIGEDFARMKEKVYRHHFTQPDVQFYLAMLEGEAVGSFILVSSNDYLEIDNVLTDKDYRHQGVASSMFHFIQKEAKQQNKAVILIVDAEDTPREMYKKMGFQAISSRISAEKTIY